MTFSNILHKVFRSVIGLYPSGLNLSFSGFGIGITVPFFHVLGQKPSVKILLNIVNVNFRVFGPKFCIQGTVCYQGRGYGFCILLE